MNRGSSALKRKRSDCGRREGIDSAVCCIQRWWSELKCPITLSYINRGDRFRMILSRRAFSASALSGFMRTSGDVRHPLTRIPFLRSTTRRLFRQARIKRRHADALYTNPHLRREILASADSASVLWDVAVSNLESCITLLTWQILEREHVLTLLKPVFTYFSRFGSHEASGLLSKMNSDIEDAIIHLPDLAIRLNSLKRMVNSCRGTFQQVSG
jgi:hypothetical protein